MCALLFFPREDGWRVLRGTAVIAMGVGMPALLMWGLDPGEYGGLSVLGSRGLLFMLVPSALLVCPEAMHKPLRVTHTPRTLIPPLPSTSHAPSSPLLPSICLLIARLCFVLPSPWTTHPQWSRSLSLSPAPLHTYDAMLTGSVAYIQVTFASQILTTMIGVMAIAPSTMLRRGVNASS